MLLAGDDKERLLQMARENGSQAQLLALMQAWEDSAQVVWLMKPGLRDKVTVARIVFDDRTADGKLVTTKQCRLLCNGGGWEIEEIETPA